jgi:hypothetical protein
MGEDTREEYPDGAWVSRCAWRAIVLALAATAGAIGLALLALGARPDARRVAPLWSEKFGGAIDEWLIDPGQGIIAAGRLLLFPLPAGSPALAIHALPLADFVAETQARVSAGSTDNGYGIVVGGEGALTAYLISGDGYFSIVRYAGWTWTETRPWRPWPHIRRGTASNTLRLECRGSGCAFYVNEEFTTEMEIENGRTAIGLIAWRYSAERLTVEFESLSVWGALQR